MAKITDAQMQVLVNCIGAVETGGQIYGQRRYDDYTNAYTNSSAENSITIGAFQEFNWHAKDLLTDIYNKYPEIFKKYDNADLISDIKKSTWDGYNPAKNSAKAKAIVNIINSSEGRKVQDERIIKLLNQYISYAESLGVTEVDALFMCANFIHQGGNSACKRIIGKTTKPYTLDKLYNSTLTDTGNQVGAYKTRQKKMYDWIKTYISNQQQTTTKIETKEEKKMTFSEAKSYVQTLLKHYPFVYCPTLAGLTSNKTPHKGDIVLFYRNGDYVHTGYVYKVSGSNYYTIEGNTSGASGVIANGGGVCKKSYTTSSVPGSKFFTPDYNVLVKIGVGSTINEVIDKIIAIAENEVGYLEKASNSNLDSKTGNAGSNNYTKYWRDIYPSYQAQPWCACFVTWIIQTAIDGQTTTTVNTSTINTQSTSGLLQKGSKGEAVKTMQTMLIKCGYSCGSAGADGDFGEGTLNGLKAFQKAKGLEVDGIYGPNSKKTLESLYNQITKSNKFNIQVTASALNIRSGPGTNYNIVGTITDKGYYTIVEQKNNWGKLLSGAGWICLDYAKKV